MAPAKKPTHERRRTCIKQWRKFRDMTQEQVAAKMGVDYTTVGRIEKGELPYNQDYLERLAVVFTCDVTDLLRKDPTKADPSDEMLSRLKNAPEDVQERARAVVETLIKAG